MSEIHFDAGDPSMPGGFIKPGYFELSFSSAAFKLYAIDRGEWLAYSEGASTYQKGASLSISVVDDRDEGIELTGTLLEAAAELAERIGWRLPGRGSWRFDLGKSSADAMGPFRLVTITRF